MATPFTLEQEIFLLAQRKANEFVAKSAGCYGAFPTDKKTQNRADKVRDNYLEFLNEVEKLKNAQRIKSNS